MVPPAAPAASALLGKLYAEGNFPELESEAARLLERSPNTGFFWQVLGVAQAAQGKDCVQAFARAAELMPGDPGVLNQLAGALAAVFRWQDAAECYRRVCELTPADPVAFYNLGVALQRAAVLSEAEAAYERAVQLAPDFAEARFNLGALLEDSGRDAEAASCYRLAIEAKPDHAAACYNLAIVARRLSLPDEAEAMFQRALQLCPDDPDAMNNLALLLESRGRLAEAESWCRRALRHRPDFAEAHNNLGVILFGGQRFAEAEAAYAEAIGLQPQFAAALNNLAALCYKLGRLEASEKYYRQALTAAPGYAEAKINLCQTLIDMGRLDEAEAGAREVLARDPAYAPAWSLLLFMHNYSARLSAEACLEEALAYGRAMAARVSGKYRTWQCPPRPQRLRVGLVSGDFRDHPVGYFLEGPLAHIDRQKIELFAYPTNHEASALTERLKPHFAAWKPVAGISDESAAKLIQQDGVHVLIDLSGHSAHSRLPLFAWKPAPVQVAWLGYFATTGMAEMDYIVVDTVGVPEDRQRHFAEKLHYLPSTRLCFAPPKEEIAVAPLPAAANGFITFGCFQHLSKMTDRTLALWGEILSQLPSARLYIQSPQLGEGNPDAASALLARLARCGVDAARVTTRGSVPRSEYLRTYAEVDVLLDTWPYPGGTTTCEALWMGVPTLTMAGERMLERQGASLLTAAGLPDWVAGSGEEYVRKAVALSAELPALAALRRELRARVLASPLFDAERFAGNLERALWAMWSAFENQDSQSARH